MAASRTSGRDRRDFDPPEAAGSDVSGSDVAGSDDGGSKDGGLNVEPGPDDDATDDELVVGGDDGVGADHGEGADMGDMSSCLPIRA